MKQIKMELLDIRDGDLFTNRNFNIDVIHSSYVNGESKHVGRTVDGQYEVEVFIKEIEQ